MLEQGLYSSPYVLNFILNTFSYKASALPNAHYPDVVSVKADVLGQFITCTYSDNSLFIWDVKDVKHIGKYRSFLSHSDCVWGVEVLSFPYILITIR